MIILDVPQLSDEWFAARVGIPTSSCFDQIVTTKGEPSKTRVTYMQILAGERVTGRKSETFVSWDMKRGVENEPIAREVYEATKAKMGVWVDVDQVGLCYRDEEKKYSCSPDGLVGEDNNPAPGGLELKDAKDSVHLKRLFEGWPKSKHFQQIQGCMFVTGRSWWDRMSHGLGLPPLIERYYRDDKFCAALKVALDEFCEELDEVTEKLRRL